MPILVDAALAKVVIQDRPEAHRTLRAFAYVQVGGHSLGLSRKEIIQAYRDQGHSRRTAERDMQYALRPVKAGTGKQASLLVQDQDNKYRPRSLDKIRKELGVENLGGRELHIQDLDTLIGFKAAVHEVVIFTTNTDAQGLNTISRASIKKSTGAARSTQRRREQLRNIVVCPNWYLTAAPSEQTIDYRKSYRMATARGYRGMCRMRNSYESTLPRINVRGLTDICNPDLPIVDSPVFAFEYGERNSLRQSFPNPLTLSYDIVEELVLRKDQTVDCFIGLRVDTKTGEEWREWRRIDANETYSKKDLESRLSSIKYDYHGMNVRPFIPGEGVYHSCGYENEIASRWSK